MATWGDHIAGIEASKITNTVPEWVPPAGRFSSEYRGRTAIALRDDATVAPRSVEAMNTARDRQLKFMQHTDIISGLSYLPTAHHEPARTVRKPVESTIPTRTFGSLPLDEDVRLPSLRPIPQRTRDFSIVAPVPPESAERGVALQRAAEKLFRTRNFDPLLGRYVDDRKEAVLSDKEAAYKPRPRGLAELPLHVTKREGARWNILTGEPRPADAATAGAASAARAYSSSLASAAAVGGSGASSSSSLLSSSTAAGASASAAALDPYTRPKRFGRRHLEAPTTVHLGTSTIRSDATIGTVTSAGLSSINPDGRGRPTGVAFAHKPAALTRIAAEAMPYAPGGGSSIY